MACTAYSDMANTCRSKQQTVLMTVVMVLKASPYRYRMSPLDKGTVKIHTDSDIEPLPAIKGKATGMRQPVHLDWTIKPYRTMHHAQLCSASDWSLLLRKSSLVKDANVSCSSLFLAPDLQLVAGLRKFGWESHNGESYGRQELHDGKFHITTSFVKTFQSGSRGTI